MLGVEADCSRQANDYKCRTYFSSAPDEVIVLNRKPLGSRSEAEEADLRGE
jgi:hypothetical protein